MHKDNAKEKVILVSIIRQNDTECSIKDQLDELSFLALTAGAEEVARVTQRLNSPNLKTFVGSGKIREIKEILTLKQADTVIFDDELLGSQIKNIENILECKILDRTNIILDIFAKRAQTAQAKIQVELAQYKYLLPRLTRMWTHLSRQKGGIGMRGAGEKEIETDRRIIREKISNLTKKLAQIDKQNSVQRQRRDQKVRVALVGYTNAGKSTLMNLLSNSNIFAENKLFATLDTTVRKVVIKNIPFLLSDTVGFIRKLPHGLVESFKSTLDEVREADIIIHLSDISHPDLEQHIKVVNRTLKDIVKKDVPSLMVFNKIDKLPKDFFEKTEEQNQFLENTYFSKENANTIFISSKNKTNIDLLKKELLKVIKSTYRNVYPYFPITIYD